MPRIHADDPIHYMPQTEAELSARHAAQEEDDLDRMLDDLYEREMFQRHNEFMARTAAA